MDSDEKQWIADALKICEDANRSKAIILLVRRQDSNDHADLVVTNTVIPELVAAMMPGAIEDNQDNEAEDE